MINFNLDAAIFFKGHAKDKKTKTKAKNKENGQEAAVTKVHF